MIKIILRLCHKNGMAFMLLLIRIVVALIGWRLYFFEKYEFLVKGIVSNCV